MVFLWILFWFNKFNGNLMRENGRDLMGNRMKVTLIDENKRRSYSRSSRSYSKESRSSSDSSRRKHK